MLLARCIACSQSLTATGRSRALPWEAHLGLDDCVVVLGQVGKHNQQGLQHRQRAGGGGLQVSAHMVLQLVQVDVRVTARDAQLLAEVVDGLRAHATLGPHSQAIKHGRASKALETFEAHTDRAPDDSSVVHPVPREIVDRDPLLIFAIGLLKAYMNCFVPMQGTFPGHHAHAYCS